MKELLERWSQLEPKRCRVSEFNDNEIDVRINEGDMWCEVALDNIVALDLMWIQWAVQQAIITRQWYFDLSYSLEWGYLVTVGDCEAISDNNPAEALLSAYLEALRG